ncbi:hypothetical protein PGT21_029048 [Puccinia graminis f. sp. tritici]|uniref:Uncharacterized protein n=1 Tax=Puccinia graminis f. sp. tritici TaxID=56615 RepID=A0A5B0PYX6_PUCGR|nr:hypothetical protein PGT21_029048 [Puccinia graminis f. sp. tritici]KAA1109162.1 hypothetical protein PGTUg99_008737 [Puccinia graminis f. sp. tritici]
MSGWGTMAIKALSFYNRHQGPLDPCTGAAWGHKTAGSQKQVTLHLHRFQSTVATAVLCNAKIKIAARELFRSQLVQLPCLYISVADMKTPFSFLFMIPFEDDPMKMVDS